MDNIDNNSNYKFAIYHHNNYIFNLKLLYNGEYKEKDIFYIKSDGNDNNNNNCSSSENTCATVQNALFHILFLFC